MKTSLLRHATFALTSLLIATGAPAADQTVLAQLGDTEIKADDLRPYLDGLDARERAAIARDPSLLNQAVRSLVVQQLVLKEALAKKWEQQPGIQAQLDIARQNAIIQTYLQSVSKPAEGFPSAAEIQAAYDANKGSLLVPKQFRVAQVFIEIPKNADKATTDKIQARVDAVRKSLKRPDADFAIIAKAESEEQASAGRGGEIGWLTQPQLQPEIRSAISSLAKGSITDPIKMDDGWHIVKVLDIKESYTPALEEIREPLAQKLRSEQAKVNNEAYLAKLVKDNPVSINEVAISKLLDKKDK